MRWCIPVALVAACGFEGPPGQGNGDVDGDVDADAGLTADAGGGTDCVIGGIDLCAEEPEPTLGPGVIDTGSDPRCIALPQTGGPEACVIYTESVTIPDASLLVGVGTRPLIIASRGDVIIDGVVDVSSQRGQQRGAGANDGACPAVASGEDDLGGGGGGAGGSGSVKGGDGGLGDDNDSAGADGTGVGASAADAMTLPSIVRGGCPGSAGGGSGGGRLGGTGGNGGGAVALLSLTSIAITGGVRATGAGGGGGDVQAGGGGGGSGGYIGLSAPSVVNDGMVIAMGGGGGGGGVNFVNGGQFAGGPGEDAVLSTSPAGGGAAVDPAGPGGPSATVGVQSEVGAGGGGGGGGFIAVTGSASGSGVYAPDPS